MDLSPGRILIASRFLVIDLTFALEAFSFPASLQSFHMQINVRNYHILILFARLYLKSLYRQVPRVQMQLCRLTMKDQTYLRLS